MSGWSWPTLHSFPNPAKQETAGLGEHPRPTYLLLRGPRPGTSSSQAGFTAWLHLGISKPSISSSHLRLLYSSGRVAPGKTQVGADLGLHHPGNPKASAPSGQLQATLGHHHLPLHSRSSEEGGGWWSVVTASPRS